MTEETNNIELSIEQCKAIIERGEAMERLIANPDFNRLFTIDYFEKESIRLVQIRAEASMQTPERQENINKQMDGLGYARMYITHILQTAEMTKRELDTHNEELAIAEHEELVEEVSGE